MRVQRDTATLARVRAAVEDAADRLDTLMEDEDELAPGLDISSRKRQLQAALSLLEARVKKGRSLLPSPELDTFLAALIETFGQGELDVVCQKHLQTSLRRISSCSGKKSSSFFTF